MAKKKIKRFLKKAAPLLAIAGLGKAFMDSRNRKAMLEGADANEGFRMPFQRPNMRDIAGSIMGSNIGNRRRGMNLNRFTKGPAMNPSGDIFGMDATGELEFAMPAKGGRIVKTKRGGKAVRKFGKKKKQANKMRKK